MPYYSVNGTDIYYSMRGKGPALIFTHGASWNHEQWVNQVKYFSKGYKVIVWDLRGHGYSSLPQGRVGHSSFSRDLIALLDHLQVEKAILCGHSLGGHISLQTAVKYPDRVEKLILIGTPFTNRFNLWEKFSLPLSRLWLQVLSMKRIGKMKGKKQSTLNPNNRFYIESATAMIPKQEWKRVWQAVIQMESRDDLKKISCPTLLLCGDQDRMMLRQQKIMVDEIPKSKFILIKDAQHGTNLDQSDAVNESIIQFIE
ncbi:pimeloyl-ACP methyl ester carboxylesterase [Geomicrobium halophilum]|uniref:Pimeloyl-ACP methyl ester carboxylesterase n=1 Tax=Geomicrobium halophilum TaxID=549000 RepID=A0A841PLF2_9BACL|nr:alpha/beta hydrolase [Geomicrobium halophilum]MBB6448514.1 pimeloyl-ACP methyl ester carboxylesterase [Geomicrobium halophilum]